MNVLTRLETLILLSGPDAESVRAKVITLRLDKVGRESLGTVTVKERQGRGVGRDGDTPQDGLRDNAPPAGLSSSESLEEEGAGEQVFELRVFAVSGGNVGKEDRLDDAAAAPHGGDTGIVQLPAVDLGGLAHEHETLGVRDDLGGVKSLLEVAETSVLPCYAQSVDSLDELLLVALEGLAGRGLDDL